MFYFGVCVWEKYCKQISAYITTGLVPRYPKLGNSSACGESSEVDEVFISSARILTKVSHLTWLSEL